MPLTIYVRQQDKPEERKSFSEIEIIIGRRKDVPVDLDLSPDRRISRLHARLSYDMGTWWVEDLGSKHGTFHNDQCIQEKTPLQPRDRLKLGDTVLRLEFTPVKPDTMDSSEGTIQTELPVDETLPPGELSESERLEILGQIQLIAQRKQGQAMLDDFLEQLRRMFPKGERVSIILHRDKELIPVAFWPVDQAYVSFTLARRVIHARKAIIWERSVASKSSQLIPSLKDTTSAMYVPIIHNRRAKGIIHIDTTALDKSFNQTDLQRLGEVATAIGSAIQNSGEDVLKAIPSVFISYSHEDMTFVRGLASDLRRKPISVWFDERLRAGKEWREQLGAAIEALDAFVLVMSPPSVASEYVRWEIDRAKAANKRLFTLMYRPCDVPEDLKNIQYLSIGVDYEMYLAELADELYTMMERK